MGSARAPVLLIRGQSAWKPWATGRILIPLDGSERSEGILPGAERLTGWRRATLVLYQVIDPLAPPALSGAGVRPDDVVALLRADAQRYLEKVAERLREKGLRVECAAGFGRVPETIAAYAGREQVLRRLFFGSVVAAVLHSAPVPVLLLLPGAGLPHPAGAPAGGGVRRIPLS